MNRTESQRKLVQGLHWTKAGQVVRRIKEIDWITNKMLIQIFMRIILILTMRIKNLEFISNLMLLLLDLVLQELLLQLTKIFMKLRQDQQRNRYQIKDKIIMETTATTLKQQNMVLRFSQEVKSWLGQ